MSVGYHIHSTGAEIPIRDTISSSFDFGLKVMESNAIDVLFCFQKIPCSLLLKKKTKMYLYL